MAAVLACGEAAVLSHRSAAGLWEIHIPNPAELDVSVAATRRPRAKGITVHRRARLSLDEVTEHHRIPVTNPIRTVIDLATCCGRTELERVVNDADKLDLVDPETLRTALDDRPGDPGVAILRDLLDSTTLTLTDSELERRFLSLVRRVGLPTPLTQQWVNGCRVDFWWPDLGLVVETDGLRYHRTAAQQAEDKRRDQAHAAAGHTPLRFSHAQVKYEPDYVEEVLRRVAHRLATEREG
jgi:very-short-patch-repair endonuclease